MLRRIEKSKIITQREASPENVDVIESIQDQINFIEKKLDQIEGRNSNIHTNFDNKINRTQNKRFTEVIKISDENGKI